VKHHYNKEELIELKRKYDMQVSKEAIEEIKHTIDLDREIERLNNIINELEKYLDNLHWFRLGKKDENGNMEYFYASVSNFYEDTKSILKGSDNK